MAVDTEVSRLFAELDQFLDRHHRWEEPMNRYLKENLLRVNRDGYTWQEFNRGRKELLASMHAKYDPRPELCRLVERLCLIFLGSDGEGRESMRVLVAQRQGLGSMVRSCAAHFARQVTGRDDIMPLKMGLAAVVIENCASDYRDTLIALADLYVGAEEVGMDPRPEFEGAATMSTDGPTSGGCESLAATLRNFESYAVVSERRRKGPYRPEAE